MDIPLNQSHVKNFDSVLDGVGEKDGQPSNLSGQERLTGTTRTEVRLPVATYQNRATVQTKKGRTTMARKFDDDDIERLKRNISIEAICRERGIQLDKHGSPGSSSASAPSTRTTTHPSWSRRKRIFSTAWAVTPGAASLTWS